MILTRKIVFPTAILFMVLLAGAFVYFFSSLHDVYHEAEEGDLASFGDSFSAELENQKQLALALASAASGNPAIQEAFAARDRQRLLEIVAPSYELLKENNSNIIIYQYHLTDGTLFVNADDPTASETPGVALSPAVLLANVEQRPVAGLETVNGDLGIRGVVPVYYQAEHVGSVEFGIGLNETLLMSLKEKYGGEWQILLSKDIATGDNPDEVSPNPGLIVFATTQTYLFFNDPESYDEALQGESTITHPSVNGRDFAFLSTPIYDYSEQIIGVLDIVYDHTHISAVQNTRLLVAGLASLGALILGILGLVLLTRRTLQPIQTLTRATVDFAEGSVSSYANIKAGDDEIGILVDAFNRMTTQLQYSIVDLEQRVTARTQDLEDQTLRLRVAAEIARDSASARDLRELLERSPRLILNRLNFYHTGIFLLDKNKEFAVLVASPTEAGRQMIANGHKLRVGEMGIVGRVSATGEPRITLDTGTDAVHFNNPFLPNTHSEMALPLKVENHVIGVLDIQSDRPQAFDEDDVAIMQIMADQLATAIDRTRLLDEVERNLKELESAYGQFTRENWRKLAESSLTGNKGYRFDNIRIEPITELPELGAEALATGKLISSNGSNQRSEKENTVAIPIRLRGQTIGVVSLKLKEGYDETTIATLESATERLASVMESARLYEEARLRADREQSISRVTTAISASTEYEQILQATVREIGSILSDTEVAIQILDNTGGKQMEQRGR
jgi:GAF domain-containing protein/HAMP domain-containing protein